MSLSSTIATGTLLGGLLAVGVYVATAPSDAVTATVPVAPTFAPVPTPTVTELADCVAPAKLVKGVCVTRKPGPTVVLPAANGGSTSAGTSAGRTRPASSAPTSGPVVDDRDEDDDHEDEDHDEDHDEDEGDEDEGDDD